MAKYKRYQKLQKYYLGVPVEPAEYKEGELIDTKDYNSIEECEYKDTSIDIEINAGTDWNLKILQTDCESVRFETNVPMYLISQNDRWTGYKSEGLASTYYDFYVLKDYANVWSSDRECTITLCNTQNYHNIDANWLRLYIINPGHIDDLSDYRLYIRRIESYKSTATNGVSYSDYVNLYHATNSVCDPNYIPDSGSQITYNNWVATSSNVLVNSNGFTINSLGTDDDGLYHFTIEGAGTSFSPLSNVIYSHYVDLTNVTNLKNLFSHSTEYIGGNFTGWNTSNVTDMNSMFQDCPSLTTLDLSSFDTSKVTDMHTMFFGCDSLKTLDLSSFNTSNVTSMSQMFQNCPSLTTLDLSSFDTSNATLINNMFKDCYSLKTLDLSSFNTSNVKYMYDMFQNCSSLTTLNLSSFNTSKVTYMTDMFNGCSSLTTLDLSSFNTSNVTYMWSMFYGCSSLIELNISGWDLTNAYKKNKVDEMFINCTSLQKIYAYNCNEKTIECLNNELSKAGLTDKVTIITQ